MHDYSEAYLERLLERNEVPHLMLFIHGKKQAESFAKRWLEGISSKKLPHFSDLHRLTVEGKIGQHSMAAIQDLIEKANLSPFEAAGKAFLIDDAECMLPAAANALLKTIEEPPPNTLFLFTTEEPQRLLSTIRSRCQMVRFRPEKKEGKRLVETLPKGSQEIIQCATRMQEHIDAMKDEIEKALFKRYDKEMKEMNATQRHLLEQRIEGEIASAIQNEADTILQDIAFLVREKGSDRMLEALSWAKLAFQRSMPMKHVLESLFFKLMHIGQ